MRVEPKESISQRVKIGAPALPRRNGSEPEDRRCAPRIQREHPLLTGFYPSPSHQVALLMREPGEHAPRLGVISVRRQDVPQPLVGRCVITSHQSGQGKEEPGMVLAQPITVT
jgi:hypothetical protein